MMEHHLGLMEKSSHFRLSRVAETPHREPLLYLSSTVDGNIVGVGQDGLASIWGPGLKLKKSSLILDENENKLHNRKMKWVSDSILMPHYNKLIIGTCNREIRLYELSNLEPYCQIVGLETMPLHLDYSARGESECVISYGDEQGCINILLISSVAETLRNWTKYPLIEEVPTISVDAINLYENTTFIRWKVHNDWVTKIKYIHSMESIISSSNDESTALVIGCVSGTKNLKHRLKTLMSPSSVSENKLSLAATVSKRFQCDESIFKMHKGVKTFDFSKERNVIVTGGLDRKIRLWNPYVPGWAVGTLQGHSSPIGFLCISDGNTNIISVSLDSTVKVWDIEDHTCLFTVVSKTSHIRGKMEACYFSPDLNILYIAAENIGSLKFQNRKNQNYASGLSHNKPVLCCLYVDLLHHVVSCSEDSVIKVWNLENGQLIMKACDAHGGAAIICMVLDATGNSLITGSRDGTLKKWDSRSLCYRYTIKQGTSEADEVITCAYAHIYNNRYLVSVGWGSNINIFQDNEEVTGGPCLQPEWVENVKHGHKDDIVCVASCPPYFLGTSCFNGEILIWNLVSGHLCCQLSVTGRAATEGEIDDLSINKIIFLLPRLEKKKTAATLVASGPRGHIAFWNIYSSGKLFAFFSGSKERSTITDMAVSSSCFHLCTGNQDGLVCIWNIAEYAMNGPEDAPPVLLQSCCAHHCSVTSITFINEYQLVITSSLDCSIRLWTLEGEYIGTFGQRELWNIKEKLSWGQLDNNITSENVSNSFGQEPTRISATQRKSNVVIEDSTTLKIVRDDEIEEELKQIDIEFKHRSKRYQSKLLQPNANGTKNTYHSLPLSELDCELIDFCKPNLTAVFDDPFQLVI